MMNDRNRVEITRHNDVKFDDENFTNTCMKVIIITKDYGRKKNRIDLQKAAEAAVESALNSITNEVKNNV